jgi:lysyl-tRNA synthetase class 2
MEPTPLSDFLPAAPLLNLQRRSVLTAMTRRFFEDRGYWEVETPTLSTDLIVDAWIEPFVTTWLTDPQRWQTHGEPRFLQTSPEAHMKRLLAAGATAIFQFSRVFRNGEFGRRHNPEFTLLEWYRVGDDHSRQMDLVEQLVRTVLTAAKAWRAPGDSLGDVESPFERLSYDDAFERFAGRKVLSASNTELAELAAIHRLTPPPSLALHDRDGWLNFLLAELIEPRLGRERPAFLYDYPPSQAALARVTRHSTDGPLVAERFELYINGVELCNGYHELTDPVALERRMSHLAAIRAAEGLRPLPSANRLLAAMSAGLPASSGVALGFDRLVMLALGADNLSEVIAFPFDRA